MRESRALLRAVLDAVPAVINVRDPDGRYVLLNQAHSRFHGCGPEHFIGRTPAEVLPPDYGRHIMERDRQILETGIVPAMVEDEYTDPEGRVTTWLGTKAPVLDAEGLPKRFDAEASMSRPRRRPSSLAQQISRILTMPFQPAG